MCAGAHHGERAAQLPGSRQVRCLQPAPDHARRRRLHRRNWSRAWSSAFHCRVHGRLRPDRDLPRGHRRARDKSTVQFADEEDRLRHLAMAGWPLPGCEVRVVDLAHERRAARHADHRRGRDARRSTSWTAITRSPQATAAVMTDAWLHTGDMAVWDEDDYIHIVDRKKDIIIQRRRKYFVHRSGARHLRASRRCWSAPWWRRPIRNGARCRRPSWCSSPGHALDQRELCDVPAAAASRKFKMPRRFEFARDQPCPRPARARSSNASCARRSGGQGESGTRIDSVMWQQNYTPIGGSLPLSALVAALPIFVAAVLLGVMRKPAWMASLAGLARPPWWPLAVYGMPLGQAGRSPSPTARRSACSPSAGWCSRAILLYRVTRGERQVRSAQGLHRAPDRRSRGCRRC